MIRPVERHFRILDVGLTLGGPSGIVDPIAFAYRRFHSEQPADTGTRLRVELSEDSILVDERSVPVIPGLDTAGQFYNAFQNALMDRIETHAVLHAAALSAPGDRAVILAAPSGHGKSSLSLELASRGWGFLGDDYAPLTLDDSRIWPYPRAVGLLPEGRARVPPAFRELAAAPDAVWLLDKNLVDVGQALGEEALADGPRELGHVFLLSSGERTVEDGSRTSEVRVAGWSQYAGELDAAFSSTDGVRVLDRGDGPGYCSFRLALDHSRRPTVRLGPLLDSNRVMFYETLWEAEPSFDAGPEVEPIKRRLAAEMLGRELLNRRSGSALLARYGSLPRLFLHVAGALRRASCWRVRIGDFDATVELIRRTVDEAAL